MAQRPHSKADATPPDDEPDGRSRKPFLLRLPKELHDEVRTWADEELRSLNGHIEYLLREAVRQRRRRK
ncbi:MAG: Arc family DNA-binding protein [Planctomycetaceae bacterium]|nr:Arc family DNA-binding protein [Planctomycetaceae bacterium]